MSLGTILNSKYGLPYFHLPELHIHTLARKELFCPLKGGGGTGLIENKLK